jgi:hypothetical protein
VIQPEVLPVLCSRVDHRQGVGLRPGRGEELAECSRCRSVVGRSTRIADELARAGVEVQLICTSCWTAQDKAALAAIGKKTGPQRAAEGEHDEQHG